MTPSAVVASSLARGARQFLAVIVGIQVLAVLVLAIVNGSIHDPITESVWEWPGVVWIRYPIGAFGGAMMASTLLPFLANGVTRRQYLRGAALFALYIAGIVVAVGIGGYAVERIIYAAGGWDTDLVSQAPVHLATVYLLLSAAYIVTGALIGAGYMRWSPARASWMITPFCVPAVAAELLLGTLWGGVAIPRDADRWLSLLISGPAVALLLAASAWLVFVLMRDVSIRPKKG